MYPQQMMPVRPPQDPKRHPSGTAQQGPWVTQDPKTRKPVYLQVWFIAAIAILVAVLAVVLLTL